MDLVEIKRINLRIYLTEKYGVDFNARGYGICPFHPGENSPSFQVNLYEGVWRFTDWHLEKEEPGFSGTIIDFVAKKEGIPIEEAISRLKSELSHNQIEDYERKRGTSLREKTTERKYYVYRNLDGKEVFRKIKSWDKSGLKYYWIEKKVNGRWKSHKGSFYPLPYNLDKFQTHDKLIICEGEKDANTVNRLGTEFLATTAPTGAHNWDDRLTPHFVGKAAFIFLYDVGNEKDVFCHAEKLHSASPDTKILVGRVPLQKHEADITDYLGLFPDKKNKRRALLRIIRKAKRFAPLNSPRVSTEPMPEPAVELEIRNRFLRKWVGSLSRITDAPKIFLIFSGIALLSAVLNKFYFMYPRRTHLNMFVLLLAPSTYYRKSTCTDIVSDYLEEINPDIRLPDSFTVEALINILGEHPRGIIIWPELIQVKEFQMGREYNRGLPAFLTDIYDFKKRIRRWTVAKGEKVVDEPIVSILAAGISDWYTKNLQAIDFHGGIWTRFLLVPAPEQDRAFSLPEAFEFDHSIVEKLTQLDSLDGDEIDLSKIRPLLREWGEKHQQETLGFGTGILSAMFQRLEVMLLKLAAILQLAHDQSFTVTPKTFIEAVKIIEYIKAYLPSFFTNEIHFGEYEKARAVILKFIRRKGRVRKKDILQGTKIPKKLTDPALQQLIEEEEIREIKISAPERGGRPGHEYEYVVPESRQR